MLLNQLIAYLMYVSHYCFKVVVVIGNYASGADISRDIASVAKEVHIASRTIAYDIYEKLPGLTNLWLHSMVRRRNEREKRQ